VFWKSNRRKREGTTHALKEGKRMIPTDTVAKEI
jgi:hypothetical protein